MIFPPADDHNRIGGKNVNSECFSKNMKQLRLEKKLTQQQAADKLGVSMQSVSHWECGNTLPDVMLLPEIARLYGVTVDDLFRDRFNAYSSYAQRLLSIYEASRDPEDFLAAEQEFRRMAADKLDAEDLRAWGVLYHYMMNWCIPHAQKKLDEAMKAAEDEQTYCQAAAQKIALLYDLGRGREAVEEYDRKLNENPADIRWWRLCIAARFHAGEYERALEVVFGAMEHFPDRAVFHVFAGDILWRLKRHEEAFAHWRRALEMDDTFLDAAYSMGFCYEELGKYTEAYRVWTELAKEMERRGFIIEKEFPESLAEKCREKMKQVNGRSPV